MYVLRVNLGRERGVRYGTSSEDRGVHIQFVRKTKPTGRRIGGLFVEVEQSGWDKSRVNVSWRSDQKHPLINDRGHLGLSPGNTHFRLLERHQHIRRLTPQDEGLLHHKDRLIAEREADLKRIRDERAELFKTAWRRAEKVPLYELEDQAARNSPDI